MKPVIHIRKPPDTDLYDGIYLKEGGPTCLGTVPTASYLSHQSVAQPRLQGHTPHVGYLLHDPELKASERVYR